MKSPIPGDLRQALALLEAMPGQLSRVTEPIAARGGLAAHYAKWAGTPAAPPTGPGPAVLYTHITTATEGVSQAVLMGLYGTRSRAAALLGATPKEVAYRLADAVAAPVAPIPAVAPAARASLALDLTALPIPVLTEQDAGPYLTLGAVLATDPDTGVRNLSVHRMCVQGPDRLTIWMVPGRDLEAAYQAALRRGTSLPLAIHLGLGPAIMLASCCPTSLVPPGMDELAIAGSLAGQPVELAPCRTVPAEHIAHAEYVIEGELTGEHMPENSRGDVATPEFLGYQGRAHPSLPVIRVTAITARRSAILQSVSGPGYEQSILLGFGMEAAVLALLRQRQTPITAVHCHTAGGGQLMVVLQWSKRHESDDTVVREASASILEVFRMAKMVVSVDDDVDIESDQDLWWAMVTRMQVDRDLQVLPDRIGFPLDPTQNTAYSGTLTGDGRTAKAVFDCTVPFALRHRFGRPLFTALPIRESV